MAIRFQQEFFKQNGNFLQNILQIIKFVAQASKKNSGFFPWDSIEINLSRFNEDFEGLPYIQFITQIIYVQFYKLTKIQLKIYVCFFIKIKLSVPLRSMNSPSKILLFHNANKRCVCQLFHLSQLFKALNLSSENQMIPSTRSIYFDIKYRRESDDTKIKLHN